MVIYLYRNQENEKECMAKVLIKRYTDKFVMDDRGLEEQASQTIKGDPVLALVELITNTDNRYTKMEEAGLYPNGKILIRVTPRRPSQTIYEVFDSASGIDEYEMIKKVRRIGADVSGLTEETGGRSFFGRGLKECMIAFGKAFIYSIKDGQYYEYSSQGVNLQDLPDTRIATKDDYKHLGLQEGSNGTLIQLFVVNKKIKSTPRFPNLARSLQLHYSLRDIMANPRRTVTLQYGTRDLKGWKDTKAEKKLGYQQPRGEKLLSKAVRIQGYPAEAILEIYRAEIPIPDVQPKYESERGFLIASKNAIHDIYNFGFENQGLIFGRVTCYYFDHLMREIKDATWINASRDGIKWRQHDFCIALENAVITELALIFKKEQEASETKKRRYENEETRERVKEALDAFNKIAREELEELGMFGGPTKGNRDTDTPPDDDTVIDRPPRIIKRVPNGFAFTPSFVRMTTSKAKTITLSVELSDSITQGMVVDLSTNSEDITLSSSVLKISDFMNNLLRIQDNGREISIVRMQAQISCDESGTEAEIQAECGTHKAKLEVIVQEKSSGGLFSDYEFDPDAPKEQRVQFIRATGVVKIATSAPSIINYFGPNGEHQNSKEAKVLLAELILDACCAELVRLKVNQEGILLGDDPAAISESIKFRINDYKDRFAEATHKIIVK